jgi:hypothetical protein
VASDPPVRFLCGFMGIDTNWLLLQALFLIGVKGQLVEIKNVSLQKPITFKEELLSKMTINNKGKVISKFLFLNLKDFNNPLI